MIHIWDDLLKWMKIYLSMTNVLLRFNLKIFTKVCLNLDLFDETDWKSIKHKQTYLLLKYWLEKNSFVIIVNWNNYFF